MNEIVAKAINRQLAELATIEGQIKDVRCMTTGSIAVRFEKAAYWVKIEKQNDVCADSKPMEKSNCRPYDRNSAY